LITFELPTIARNGVGADCVAFSVQILGTGVQTIYLHQVELYQNLIDNPSLETGAGNPWIPDGWTNFGLDAGDTQAEAGIMHSGVGSMRWNAGAVANESAYQQPAAFTQGKFFAVMCWGYSTGGTGGIHMFGADQAALHSDPAEDAIAYSSLASWHVIFGVYRQVSGAIRRFALEGLGAAGGLRYTDDAMAIVMDDVTLTVTPASKDNSTEDTGLRVDGLDTCTQPIPSSKIKASRGRIRWRWTPRHSAGDFVKFGGGAPDIAMAFGDATNFIRVRCQTATNIRLLFNDGSGQLTGDWDATGSIAAGTTYLLEIVCHPGRVAFYADGVERIAIATSVDFDVIPTILHWSAYATAVRGDATLRAP
jgi:hypothetical protein